MLIVIFCRNQIIIYYFVSRLLLFSKAIILISSMCIVAIVLTVVSAILLYTSCNFRYNINVNSGYLILTAAIFFNCLQFYQLYLNALYLRSYQLITMVLC